MSASARISKEDAARREIETAIDLYFANGDSLSIHTLAFAAFKVLFDLYPNRVGDGFGEQLDNVIKKEGWRAMSKPANFLKHADNDPDAFLESHHPEQALGVIGLATILYRRITGDLSPKMMALDCWVEWLAEEELGIEEIDTNAERAAEARAFAKAVAVMPHEQKMLVGKKHYDLFLANLVEIRADLDHAKKDGTSITQVLDATYAKSNRSK